MYKVQNPNEITWNEVADLMSSQLGEIGTSNKYRKEFTRKFKDIFSQMIDTEKEDENEEIDVMASLDDKLAELRKERTLLSDIRRDANAQLRRLDREDSIIQIAEQFAQEMSKHHERYELNPIRLKKSQSNKAGLLLLSDWHYGLDIKEYFNKYSPEICKKRLGKILSESIRVINEEDISTVYVFNLSDLISGRIHSQLRMQSRIDAVTQTLEVTELLYDFLNKLSEHCKIEYFDCLDNHSRIEPNKKESLQLESFVRIINWYLYRSCDKYRITVHKNNSMDIIDTNILGHKIVGVHGDNDSPNSVVKNMSSLLGERPDLVVMAHRHHFSADEQNKCIVLCNPSLMGADRYALDHRLDSSPSQLFVVVTEDNPVEKIYRLLAD